MRVFRFIENFSRKFSADSTTTLAASLAFYTALSLAPLLILFVTISAHLSPQLQSGLIQEVDAQIGAEAAATVDMIVTSAKTRPDLTSLASLLGLLTLLFSASLIFGELRSALNRIFSVQPPTPQNESFLWMAWRMLKEKLTHVFFALGFILTLIASLIASSVISSFGQSEQKALASALNISLSFIFYVLLFTLMYRFLPDRRQPLNKAAKGGVLTAALFVIGKEFIAIYLGNSAIGSAYGAAGSVIVLLVWVYYSTMITFIGAQVSALLIGVQPRRTSEA